MVGHFSGLEQDRYSYGDAPAARVFGRLCVSCFFFVSVLVLGDSCVGTLSGLVFAGQKERFCRGT